MHRVHGQGTIVTSANCNYTSPDSKLPSWCKWVLSSSGMLRGLNWWLVKDVSVQPIGLIIKGQTDFLERDSRSSGILRGLNWWLVKDVSVQPIGLIIRGQTDFLERDSRSSGILRRLYWWSVKDVSVQPISPTFKGQTVQERCPKR